MISETELIRSAGPARVSVKGVPRPPLNLTPGEIVVVRPMDEILATLDSDGTLDGLPLMPEMNRFCGQQFRVMQRVVQACVDGAFLQQTPESFVREFRNRDVVTLEDVRCSGKFHGGCQRGCAIFWKEAWLERVPPERVEFHPLAEDVPHPGLKTTTGDRTYFCQSSEFLRATLPLSFSQRLRTTFLSVACGNATTWTMMKRIVRWMWWKLRFRIAGEHAKGSQVNTPTEVLNLQPGELVEVKSIAEIAATLNAAGRNRGLHFSGDQRIHCGKRYRVRSRADNYIAEGSGQMKHFRNTVILEDVLCDSSYYAFGGCCRSDLLYWREIWLKRVE